MKFGYVWDDQSLFLNNTWLREDGWSWESIARPILPGTSYFRPLVLASWVAEMKLFQLTPFYSHMINIILHGINTCLVYILALYIFERYKNSRCAALITALIYTVHPCLVEAVAWISGRFDLLATTLLMAGCVAAMGRGRWLNYILFALFGLGAMLSKETGLLLAPILILLTLARFSGEKINVVLRGLWPYLLVYTATVIFYFLLRRQGLGFVSYSEFGISQVVTELLSYEDWARKLAFYTFMAIVPFSDITPRHDLFIEMLSYRQNAIAVAVALLIMFLTIFYSLRKNAWAILLLGFYVGISPVLGIVSISVGDSVGAERFLYLPLVMLALAIVEASLKIQEKFPEKIIFSVVGKIFLAGWLALSILVTYTVASMWESGIRLWTWQYQVNPKNHLIRSSYLIELSSIKTPEAIEKFEEEINSIRNQNDGGLPGDVQILYANFLLENNNPESINYIQGLINSIDVESGRVSTELRHKTTETAAAGIYSNYAQALIIFERDLKNARKFLEKSKALNVRGFEFNIIHQMIVINYLEGNFQVAQNMYKDNFNLLKSFNIMRLKNSMKALVMGYCQVEKTKEECLADAQKFLDYLDAGLK